MKKKKDNKLGIVIKMSSWMLRRREVKRGFFKPKIDNLKGGNYE